MKTNIQAGYFKKKKLMQNLLAITFLPIGLAVHTERLYRTFLLQIEYFFNSLLLLTQPILLLSMSFNTQQHLQKKLNDGNSFLLPKKITKQRIAKFISTNAFCKYNCFAQKNQTV